jgi:peptide/nickel transport system permease protein
MHLAANLSPAETPKTRNRFGFVAKYRSSAFGSMGLALLIVVVAAGMLAPFLTPYGSQTLSNVDLGPPLTPQHVLGTDALGRDIAADLLFGARVSLAVGLISGLISALVGVSIGSVAGYFGGWVDAILSEITNVFLMIPSFFLILLVVALFGAGLVHEMVVIGLTIWPANARLMRAQVLSLRERPFVDGERALGKSPGAILVQHIIPNGIHPVVAHTTLQIAGAILIDAGLSFLGLGDPNLMSWGQMIYQGTQEITTGWWVSVFSGVVMTLTVLAFYFVSDGLSVALDPRLVERRGA